MIYKDAKAEFDEDNLPSCRSDEECLNCGAEWDDHCGWSCPGGDEKNFYCLSPEDRYETQSMRASLSAPKVAIMVAQQKLKARPLPQAKDLSSLPQVQTKDLSDWRAWRNQAPGECPCGIVKTMCDYHR